MGRTLKYLYTICFCDLKNYNKIKNYKKVINSKINDKTVSSKIMIVTIVTIVNGASLDQWGWNVVCVHSLTYYGACIFILDVDLPEQPALIVLIHDAWWKKSFINKISKTTADILECTCQNKRRRNLRVTSCWNLITVWEESLVTKYLLLPLTFTVVYSLQQKQLFGISFKTV